MKLGTRSRIAIAAAVLSSGALLAPATPAVAYTQCVPDHCDTLLEYYSDATYTVRVGEYGSEVCGAVEWGQQTQYVKRFWRYC